MADELAPLLAGSRDGRTFALTGSAPEPFVAGDMVTATLPDGTTVLGQLLDVGDAPHGGLAAAGVVVGTVATDGALDRRARPTFAEASVAAATPEMLSGLQEGVAAATRIGTWLTAGGEAPALLRAGGFNRHTFLCGQSGSGKTYALGVVLERLLIDTELRVAVLDPNADFVRLDDVRDGAQGEDAERLRSRTIRVLRSDASRADGKEQPLRLRFRTMPRAAQAAVLQLDPVLDNDEYNAFVRFVAGLGGVDLGGLLEGLRAGTPAEQQLARRMENLGLTDWEVWARDLDSAADVVTGGTGVTIMDLGGFRHPGEPVAVALEVVEELWAQRDRRIPTLVVIDEAHNLCPAAPEGPVARLLVDRLIQIAAEGRKYGLWLFLSSQRPSKIHPQVLSQCDNLVLMRMNSPDDIAELGRVFGFVPPAMLSASTGFLQGEMLLAGPMAPVPMLARVRERLTREGGSDVAVPLATRPTP